MFVAQLLPPYGGYVYPLSGPGLGTALRPEVLEAQRSHHPGVGGQK